MTSKYKLSEICTIKYGKDHKSLYEGTIPVYGSGGIIRYVDDVLYDKKSVLIPRKGTLSNLFYVDEPFWTIDTLFYTEINERIVLPKFLYFKLKTIDFAGMNVGTAVPSLTTALLNEIEIELPSLDIQKSIANILSSFDDKIENNHKIVANLEAQAQELFKENFIDNKLDIKKFPAKYENIKLGGLFKFVKGKKPKNIFEQPLEYTEPYIVKKYIDGTEYSYARVDDKLVLIDEYDVFMLMDGANSGNIYTGYKGILGSTFSLLQNENPLANEYLYWYLLINQEQVKRQNTGSAIPHVNKDYINNIEVTVPKNIQENSILKNLHTTREYLIYLRNENKRLAETRDALLPKLMSGELRVNEL